MGIETPDNTKQIEDRVKADVQRSAPDSNPYLTVSWLRSFIASFARRMFDFYQDLKRTEQRVMFDTEDETNGLRVGAMYVGASNQSSSSSGKLVAQGTAGASISIGTVLKIGDISFNVLANSTIALNTLTVLSITRSGTTATVETSGDHNLSSFVPATISGAVETEYNGVDLVVTVIDKNKFTYDVSGSPSSPATGTITAAFTSASVSVESVETGDNTNFSLDTKAALQAPIVNVDNDLYVDFGAIGGGTDAETFTEYRDRYLDKIRNPVAHYSVSDIISKAKEISGVTRVFVYPANYQKGTVSVSSITRSGNIAKVTTADKHGLIGGQSATISGSVQDDYNVIDSRVLVEDDFIFYIFVLNSPTTPATGTIAASLKVPLGQSETYIMRDNDSDSIPDSSEIAVVKDKIDEILPANTASVDCIVLAPTPVPVDFTFTSITPDSLEMRSAVEENIEQFFQESTSVGDDVEEDDYRCAINDSAIIETGEVLESFILSSPSGNVTISHGQISTKGSVAFL